MEIEKCQLQETVMVKSYASTVVKNLVIAALGNSGFNVYYAKGGVTWSAAVERHLMAFSANFVVKFT